MENKVLPGTVGELRVAIRYNTLDVPGLPGRRAQRVADDFAASKLSRRFNYAQDFIHCPSDFDSDISKSVWILCDFNVRERRPDIDNIPIQFWKASYGGSVSGSFKVHGTNAKQFVKMFPWGGWDNEWDYRIQQRGAGPN